MCRYRTHMCKYVCMQVYVYGNIYVKVKVRMYVVYNTNLASSLVAQAR